jgi:hypothetical protein
MKEKQPVIFPLGLNSKAKLPLTFSNKYLKSEFLVINSENFFEYFL